MSSLKKYTGVILFVLLCLEMQAQDTGIASFLLNSKSNNLHGKMIGHIYNLSSDANTFFLYPAEWVEGEITFTNGDTHKDLKLRYQAYDDELLAYNENGRFIFMVEKELVNNFSFVDGSKTRKFVRLNKSNNRQTNIYLEELYKGEVSLLVNWYIYEQSVSPYIDRNGIKRAIDYQMHKDYYFLKENNGLQKIKLNRKALFIQFPEHKKAIKRLLRKQNLIIRNEQAMAMALSLIKENGLME